MKTNAQYMSDMTKVERIVQRFMNVTLRELNDAWTKRFLKYITDEVFSEEELSEEKSSDMSYVEFTCLIDNVVNYECEYEGYHDDMKSWQMLFYKFLMNVLIEKSRNSIPVKLFLALPLKSFYGYLDEASKQLPDEGLSNRVCLQFDLYELTENCKDKDSYTIKEFLLDKGKIINSSWCPVASLEEYTDNIITAHKAIGKLLVGSFHQAFPDRFQLEDIRDKYHDPYIADEYEDYEWQEFDDVF